MRGRYSAMYNTGHLIAKARLSWPSPPGNTCVEENLLKEFCPFEYLLAGRRASANTLKLVTFHCFRQSDLQTIPVTSSEYANVDQLLRYFQEVES